MVMITPNNVIAIQNANPPHRGAVTHHHDQSITSHNFSVINTMASNPKNEMPFPDFFVSLLIILIIKICGGGRSRTCKPLSRQPR